MILFPAIDVLDNRAVRLLYGKRDNVTDYGSPQERAAVWRECGAKYLHLVDLNGAFDDSAVNDRTLKEVIREIDIPVQIGGGVKTFDKARYYLEEVGAARVIIGSACVTDKKMVEKAFAAFGNKIACGIDAKDGKVCIKGWVDKADISPAELALEMKSYGADVAIYTDISRDGALSGVNAEATEELARVSGLNVIASGGMRGYEDIRSLMDKGVYGAILGRAIYTGNIDLKRALEMTEGKC